MFDLCLKCSTGVTRDHKSPTIFCHSRLIARPVSQGRYNVAAVASIWVWRQFQSGTRL